jgi:hypothetical protein
MYISLGVLAFTIFAIWLIVVLEEWWDERQGWKEYQSIKREYEKTHHWDDTAPGGGQWVRNDGDTGD